MNSNPMGLIAAAATAAAAQLAFLCFESPPLSVSS
ncbi:hypothetical protein A2U01_0112774 [Trifolium medium]|uniref:Uncharacterized protein n=1 Tax=Trifolium medium TaxID=97028 RepID=A0A392VYE4_9FABA|nr:hypothetical protein [Trifolium medium]